QRGAGCAGRGGCQESRADRPTFSRSDRPLARTRESAAPGSCLATVLFSGTARASLAKAADNRCKVAFVCCIALSRIVLGAHSIAEVSAGVSRWHRSGVPFRAPVFSARHAEDQPPAGGNVICLGSVAPVRNPPSRRGV